MENRLAKHIEELLLSHSCVVVPDLGGFVLQESPARYDERTQLAYPPQVRLSFNEALTHQDGLLIERYASLYGVSLRRARLMLEDDVRRLRQALVRLRAYELPALGRLCLGAEGEMSFDAKPSVLINSLSYGLSAVSLPLYEPAVGRSTAQDEDTRYLHLRIPKRALGYAAAVVVCLLALLPWGGYFSAGDAEPSFSAGVTAEPKAVQEFVAKATSSVTKPQAEAEPAPAVEQAPQEEVTDVIPELKGRYYVVIATERSEERAKLYLAKATELGLTKVGIQRGRSVHRVIADSFDSATDAYNYIKQLPTAYREAWVYQGK